MFNSLRKLFGKRGGATLDAPGEMEHADSAFTSAPVVAPRAGSSKSVRVDAQPVPHARPGTASANIGVPLKSIIGRLPADLMQRVRQVDVGEAEILIPTQKVLSQISTGAVRLSFGELRQLAPPGTFTAENDRDRTLVELPLYEILARLNPGLLVRRPAQKHVEVPAEVVGPFGGQNKVTISNQAAKTPVNSKRPMPTVPPPPRAQPAVAAPAQAMPRVQPPAGMPAMPSRTGSAGLPPQPVFARIRPSSASRTAPAPAPQPVPPPMPAVPVASPVPAGAHETEEAEQPIFSRVNFTAPVAPAEPVVPQVFSPIAPDPEPQPTGDTDVIQMPENYRPLPPTTAPISPIAPEAEPEPEPIRFSAPPERSVTPVAPAVPVTSGETRFITVAIAEVSEVWPEAVRGEINAQNLSGSWIGLPLGAVEGVIKSGKIAFPWKALRSWVKPPIPAAASPYDTTMLEMPLKIVTPLFLAELKSNRTQRKFSVDQEIPDLFFNSQPVETNLPVVPATPVMAAPTAPVPTPPASPVPAFPAAAESARPADTNYFVWKETTEEHHETDVFVRKGTNAPGTAFLNRYATPNEIVSKTAALDGVDGALIALPDGLLVASKIPNNMNADTIAAFLPQIFGRVSQCTRELRLGELNNLNFTVGNIPWKIFRVGSIYFAAFGRPGVPLPTAQLVGLAAELDRKAK